MLFNPDIEKNIRYDKANDQGGAVPEVNRDQVEAEAKAHVEANTTDLDLSESNCSDGRTPQEQGKGYLARLGADGGWAMAVEVALGCSAEEAFDLVDEFRKNLGQFFNYHTDNHAADGAEHQHDGQAMIGCGHLFRATLPENADLYGVKPGEVENLIQIIQTASHDRVRRVLLDGDHKEKGVLLVRGVDKTVVAWDQEANNQYFIYNVDADQEMLQHLVVFLKGKGKDITFEQLWAVIEKHNNATLSLLAGNKPLIEISFSEDETPNVKFLKIIEPAKKE